MTTTMAMTASANSTLIEVRKTDGRSQAYLLDPDNMLDAVRVFLTKKGLMNINDSFLISGTAVDRDQEPEIALFSIVKDNKLTIGQPTGGSAIDTDDGVARYNLLNDDQKRAIFDNIQIFRGLRFTANRLDKSFKDVCSWESGYTPVANRPNVITELISNFAFNKVTSELKTTSSDSTSVNVSSPYGSAEAEYKTEKSKTTSKSTVTEYLTTKYLVRKADLQIDPLRLEVKPDFVAAVKKALKGNERTADGYYNLIAVLNEYGYYVPVEFTLGGAVIGTDQTEISDFSVAESEKKEFNGSFKAEFEGIGGGAAYSNASGTDKTDTKSSKYQNITMQLIGGDPGLEKDYPAWAKTLDKAIKWGLADVSKYWPTLELLARDDEGRQLLTTAISLIEKFAGAPNSAKLQPFLDMRAYNTNIQVLVNPFA
jgi:MAC/Perforin domain